jgi:hypothetical protein
MLSEPHPLTEIMTTTLTVIELPSIGDPYLLSLRCSRQLKR